MIQNLKTPEERRASAAKGRATRARNKSERTGAEQRAAEHAMELRHDIGRLREKLASLQRYHAAAVVHAELTGRTLLTEEEIVAASSSWARSCGVYFLILNGRVVYVGQSVHVFSRINSHTSKNFDSYAFVPCSEAMLNKLESLYIHVLKPPLNGTAINGMPVAPLSLDALLGSGLNRTATT